MIPQLRKCVSKERDIVVFTCISFVIYESDTFNHFSSLCTKCKYHMITLSVNT